MPSGSFIQVYVGCPFYQFDDGKRRIICEGIIPGTKQTNTFHNKKEYAQQITVFCCEHYKCCELHRALMERYQEEE